MGREFELKFAASEAVQRRIEEKYGPFRRMEMASVYFDTPDRAFARRHITLRRRLENGVGVCTVKTPLPDGSRGEWELVWDEPATMVTELCKLGAPEELRALSAEGIAAVCGAEFVRLAKSVSLPGGEIELALDLGRLTAGSKAVPLCEVEVELKSGVDAVAEAFAAALAAEFGLKPEPRSKFSRAKALAEEKDNV